MLKMDVIIQQKLCSRNVEIPGGRGVIKDPLGTEIPKGWGVQTEKPSVGGVWIFSGTTQFSSNLKKINFKSRESMLETGAILF